MTETFSLDDLAALIANRAMAHADESYTRSLLDSGTGRIAKRARGRCPK